MEENNPNQVQPHTEQGAGLNTPTSDVNSTVPSKTSDGESADFLVKHSRKYIIMAVIAFIILGAAAGFLIWKNTKKAATQPTPTPTPESTPTPDPTANWKTYTNADWRIIFKYPEKVPSLMNPLRIAEEKDHLSLVAEGTGGLAFEISILEKTTIEARFEDDKALYKEFLEPDDPEPVLKDSTLVGLRTKEVVFKNAVMGVDMLNIYVNKNNKVYIISLPNNPDGIGNQILDTF